MSHADRPSVTRPLAGVDQALGEGRARQPVELLDQLRERLGRLDPNHPSAAGPADRDEDLGRDGGAGQDVAADLPDGQAASRADGSHPPADTAQQPADRQAGQPAPAGGASGLAGDGLHRVVEAGPVTTGPVTKGELYRPWFADEPGTPWFIGQETAE